MNRTKPANVNCPSCGEVNPATESTCHACRKSLVLYIGPERVLPRSYGLGSLMCLVAAIAVGLSLTRLAPALGVVMLLIVVPATIRTITVASQKREDHLPFNFESRVIVFVESMGLMIGVLFCAFATGGLCLLVLSPAAQSPPAQSPTGLIFALVISGLLSLGVVTFLLVRFWRYKH